MCPPNLSVVSDLREDWTTFSETGVYTRRTATVANLKSTVRAALSIRSEQGDFKRWQILQDKVIKGRIYFYDNTKWKYIACWTSKRIASGCLQLPQQVLLGQKEATARIRGGLRRDGPNDLMFLNNLIQKDLYISILFYLFVLLVMFSIFCNLSTIHNLATYAY